MNPSMAPVETSNKICSTQVKENTERSAVLCVKVWWEHRTDRIPWQDCWALCAGVVGQFVIKKYPQVFITFYSFNSFSFNLNPTTPSFPLLKPTVISFVHAPLNWRQSSPQQTTELLLVVAAVIVSY